MKRSVWWKVAIVLALAVALVAALSAKRHQVRPSERGGTELAGAKAGPSADPTQSLPLPRLLELGADRCIPCKMMQPILADLRKEYAGKLQVDFVDVWKNPAEADRYGVQIIPTQIFFDSNGKEVFRHLGFFPKEEIVAKFKELGIDL